MTTSHRDELAALVEDLWRARHADFRFGHEDFSQFPALIARADKLGDPYWRFKARLEAAYAAIWSGTALDVLTLSAWLLRELDQRGDEIGVDEEDLVSLNTTLADFLEYLADVPELSLEQVAALIDDLERRVAGTPYASEALFAAARASLEIHRGDNDAARAVLDAVADFSPPTGTCEEGGRTTIASLYAELGDHARAIALSEPDLIDNGDRCGFFPAETYSGLVTSYAALGKKDLVVRAAESVASVYGEFRGSATPTPALIALLRVDALPQAYDLALSRLPYVGRQFTPLAEARISAAIAATLASQLVADPDLMVLWRDEPNRSSQSRPAVEVVDLLADRAREIAKRYDLRNQNAVVSSEIDEFLALRAEASEADDNGPAPVAQRDAAGLLSGMLAFGPVSPRRCVACADLLRDRLGELSGRDLARARHLLAWDRRREDPMGAIEDLEAAAVATDVEHPAWSAQSRLLAGLAKVEMGLADPESLLEFGPPSPEWTVLAQAGIWRLLAMVVAPLDLDRAEDCVARGLDLLDRADRGELPYRGGEPAAPDGSSAEADGLSLALSLQQLRANLLVAREADPGPAVDAALVLARRAFALASTPDQQMSTQGELTEALSQAARRQLDVDAAGALLLMDEAVENARYAQRGAMLDFRWELRLEAGDVDGAHSDCEQALAVWTVEGMEFEVDEETFHLGRVKLYRGDDPRSVIELVRPAIERMETRGVSESVDIGTQVLAAAQSEAGLAEDSAISFSTLIDGLDGTEHPAYAADLRRRRALEYRSMQRERDAIADFETVAELLTAAGDLAGAADALRNAGLTAHFGELDVDPLSYLDRADELLSEPAGGPLDFERARLDLARADIIRETDPVSAAPLFASVAERARAANWVPLLLVSLQLGAEAEIVAGSPERARALVAEGLSIDPDHPGLRNVSEELG
ncbi:MAG: hypothetical protein QM658_00035 [Gordonia sp. (in: high G+C Gram-positive bacteria)]